MTTPLVWSERVEPAGGPLRDCAYSAGLTALVFGGFTAFPLGIWTVAEREALERSDDQPNETGASLTDVQTAVFRRYGLTVKVNAGGLAGLLATPGLALVVTGSLGNLPTTSKLRTWQPGYVQGHGITAITRGDGTVLWLDPLATNKYPGVTATTSDVLAFARGFGGSITVRRDQFAPATGGDMPTPTSYIPGHVATIKPTANVRVAPLLTAAVLRAVTTTERWVVTCWVKGDVDPDGGSDQWLSRWANGRWEYTAKSNASAGPTAPATDCAPAVAAALAPVQAELATVKDALAKAPELEQERIALAEADRIRGI